MIGNTETLALARKVMDRQMARIGRGMDMVCGRMLECLKLSCWRGAVNFLACAVVAERGLPAISLADQLKPALSESIAAYAVARLAQQMNHDQ